MNSVKILEDNKTRLINAVNNTNTEAHCTKCGDSLYNTAQVNLTSQIDETKKAFWQALTAIPVISAQNPLKWDYEVLDMVTGQSTTGTGVVSEFTSSWTDMFGAQSGSYNKKLKAGEALCFGQLRKQTADLGGNAVIATDIDYSEVGGDKGMLMVCMAGTAVRVKNIDVFDSGRVKKLNELELLIGKLRTLQQLS